MAMPADAPQFHAGRAMRHAVLMVWRFRKAGFAIALPWMAILAAASFALGRFKPDMAESEVALRVLVLSAISFFCIVAVSVHWHRYILLDELLPAAAYLSFDRRKLKYIGKLLGVMVLLLLGLLAPVMVLQFILPAALLPVLLAIPAYAISIGLSLGLPAVAVDAAPISYRQSWNLTRPHLGQLLGFSALLLIAAFALIFTEEALQRIVEGIGGQSASPLISLPFNMISSLLAASALTTLYGVLVQGRKV